MIVSPAKTDERLEMPFWIWNLVLHLSRVLDGGSDLPRQAALLIYTLYTKTYWDMPGCQYTQRDSQVAACGNAAC